MPNKFCCSISTAFCALAQPWEGIVIGAIGAVITNVGVELLNWMKVDDPVGRYIPISTTLLHIVFT